MKTIRFDKRKSGIPMVGEVPWGTHFCQFYQNGREFFDVCIPYFKTGLKNNERCVCVTSEPLNNEEKKFLKKNLPRFDTYKTSGQIEFVSLEEWNRNKNTAKALFQHLDKAIIKGFDGLRIAFLNFRYPNQFTNTLNTYNILALFAYPHNEFNTIGLMKVVKNHHFALVKNTGKWEILKSSEVSIIKDELKRSEEKLRSLFSNMSEGFAYYRILLDKKGKPYDYIFLEINDAFEKLTGLKAKKIIGRKVTQVLPEIQNDPANWIGKFGKVALSGKPIQFENYAQELQRWYTVSAFCPHKGYFAVTFSDITERKKAEQGLSTAHEQLQMQAEELEATNEELRVQTDELLMANKELQETRDELRKSHDRLEQRVTERTAELQQTHAALLAAQQETERARRLSDIGTLAATVAHELRNPLAAISMAVANIKRKAQNPLLEKNLSNIGKKIIESDQIINNLLFYSRIGNPHYEQVAINQILDECLESLSHRYNTGEITIIKNTEATKNILIKADPLQMKEVFSNILNNSYDAVSKPEGRIEITTVHSDGLAVCISDNGVGISAADLGKVFEPFFTTKAKGTGLGLSVCKQIIDLHDGTIGIESHENKGTKVCITLRIK